jgi:hypothetical protein
MGPPDTTPATTRGCCSTGATKWWSGPAVTELREGMFIKRRQGGPAVRGKTRAVVWPGGSRSG